MGTQTTTYEGIYEVVDAMPARLGAQACRGDVLRESEFDVNVQDLADSGLIRLIGFVKCRTIAVAA
jgi:hypothetical protein